MKRNRILALVMAVLCVCALASGALAADTDAQSQATQKSSAAEKPQLKPDSGAEAAQDSEAPSASRGRRGGKKEEAAEPENAVGKDAAKAAALADAGLSADQVEKVHATVSDSDGTAVYKVRFKYDGQRYSYRIDALSGKILDRKVADAAESSSRSRGGGRRGRAASAAEAAADTAV